MSNTTTSETAKDVLESPKGYYPNGAIVETPAGRKDTFSGPTYVLSAEAYRALLLRK